MTVQHRYAVMAVTFALLAIANDAAPYSGGFGVLATVMLLLMSLAGRKAER